MNQQLRVVVTEDALPPTFDTLPDVEGDSQKNVVSVAQQQNGLPMTIPLWENAAEFPGEFDTIIVTIDGIPLPDFTFEGPITGDVTIDLISGRLRTHGPKQIVYTVILHGTSNGASSLPIEVFVDAIDPNNNNIPDQIISPVEVIDPEYLDANDGITFTIPRPEDSRAGDTYEVNFGRTTGGLKSGDVPPAPASIEVHYTKIEVEGIGSGEHSLNYLLADRAGNKTQRPEALPITIQLTPLPGRPRAPLIVGEPLIDKEEARMGVKVLVREITDALGTDRLNVYWSAGGPGVLIGSRLVGTNPDWDLEFTAEYSAVAAPGTLYRATVYYNIERDGIFVPSFDAFVDVNLVEPGTPNPDPGPEDSTLVKPVVQGVSADPNVLIPEDRDSDTITASFVIYTNFAAGEFIDLYYGKNGGDLADTYEVIGDEADDFIVVLNIPFILIEKYGNGAIPCYYKIRNAINYKHSPAQDVTVSIYRIEGLLPPTFTNLNLVSNDIQCDQNPWLGVPVRIFDPETLEIGDLLVVHAVRYLYEGPGIPPVTPVEGSEVSTTARELNYNDVNSGFTLTLDLPYFALARRGYVGVNLSVTRSETDTGSSSDTIVFWDVRSGNPSGTCVPTPSRRGCSV
jgi:hypothetical protein